MATSFEQRETATAKLRTAMDIATPAPFGRRSIYTPPTEGEIETYRSTSYPNWLAEVRAHLAQLHQQLTDAQAWPVFCLTVVNSGTRPALDVLLKIKAAGPFLLANVAASDKDDDERGVAEGLALPLPPSPPRGSTRVHDLMAFGTMLRHDAQILHTPFPLLGARLPSPPRDDDAFYWRSGSEGTTDLIALECTSWRHRDEAQEFEIAVHSRGDGDVSGTVVLEVHAANLSVAAAAKLPVRITRQTASTFERAAALVEALGRHPRVREGR